MTEGNKPLKKFKAGAVTATVWENEGKDNNKNDTVYHTVNVERAYTKDDGKTFQNTSSMRVNDLPKLILVAQLAFKYIVLKEHEEEKTPIA